MRPSTMDDLDFEPAVREDWKDIEEGWIEISSGMLLSVGLFTVEELWGED